MRVGWIGGQPWTTVPHLGMCRARNLSVTISCAVWPESQFQGHFCTVQPRSRFLGDWGLFWVLGPERS